MNKLLSIEEVMKVLGVSRPTTYNLMYAEGFPSIKIGRAWKVPEDLLVNWIKEQSEAPKYCL